MSGRSQSSEFQKKLSGLIRRLSDIGHRLIQRQIGWSRGERATVPLPPPRRAK
jgi:hypothetical protein